MPASDSVRLLRGQCLCGAVHYRVPDAFVYAMNCHCSQCRRATGSAFKPMAGIEREKLSVVQGAERLKLFGSETGHDARCGDCGAFLWSRVRDGAWLHVTLGTLTDDPAIRPSCHIFVGSKAPWYTINDELPQYEGYAED